MEGKFKKGQSPWNKGKNFSPESREKMRRAKLGKTGHWAGKKRPEMSGSNNPNSGKFGKDHPRWVDDKKHPFHKSIRELFKYRQWRSDVFTRDDFTCVLCGLKGGLLQADHSPKRFIDIINEYSIKSLDEAITCEELWNLNNGRTLCVHCHLKTETWGRRKVKELP